MADSLEEEPAPDSGARPRVLRLLDRDNLFIVMWVLQLGAVALFTPLSTRVLGVGRFGSVAAATALAQVVYALGSLQLQAGIQRRYDEEGADAARRLVQLSVVLAVGATAIVYIAGPLWSRALGFGPFDGAPRWAVVWGGLIAMTGGSLALLKSQDRVRLFFAVTLLQSVGAQILAVTFVLGLHRTASMYVLGLLVGQAAATIVALVAARPGGAGRSDVPMARMALAYSTPLVPGAIATLVLGVADRLVLEAKLGPVAVGRYQVAYNFGALAIALLGGLNLVWLPRIIGMRDNSAKAAVLSRTRNSLYLILVPVVVGLCVGGPVLLDLAAPRSYNTHGLLIVLTLIALSALPYVDGLTSSRILIAAGQTRTLATAIVVAAAVNIDLNIVLVPLWHVAGSAVATLASYAMMAALIRWRANRELRLRRLPLATTVGLLGATALVLLWSQAPTTTPWMILRIANVAAAVLWVVLVARRLATEPSWPDGGSALSPRPTSIHNFVHGTPRSSRPPRGAREDSDGAAHGRLRRGLPAGLLDSGFSSLSSFLMGLIATHYLLPTELGEYAVFYAAFSLAAVIPATLVFTPIEVVALALPRDQRLSVLRRSVPLGGLTGLVSGVIVCAAVVPLVAKVGLSVRVDFGVTVVVLSSVSPVQDHLRRMFHQSGRSWMAARTSVIQTITVAVVIILARVVDVPLAFVPFGALVIGNVTSGLAGLRTARPEPVAGHRPGPGLWDVIRGGGWLTVGTAYGFAAGLAAITILADRNGAVAAGRTEAARVLSQPVTVVAVGVLAVFGPELMGAGQRGQTDRVNKMMLGFFAVIAAATALWLLAVGIPWPWSPITRSFPTAYKIKGLTAWTIVQQTLAYGSLAYRAVLIGNGKGRNVGKLDMLASSIGVVGVYLTAPYLGAFSIVWAFLGVDLLLFGVRGRMASQAVRAAQQAPPTPES